MTRKIRVTIFDYGAGNLHSLAKVLDVAGVEVVVECDPALATRTDALVLPGVGAFTGAAERLAPGRDVMRQAIVQGLPTLGICLGMQLLFEKSEEGPGRGLGIIPGHVRRLKARRVPQIGWNQIDLNIDPAAEPHTKPLDTRAAPDEAGDERVRGKRAGTRLPSIAYFANSYVCEPDTREMITAYTTHETDRFASAVSIANTIGVQFHPEKSSTTGVEFVHGFVREIRQ